MRTILLSISLLLALCPCVLRSADFTKTLDVVVLAHQELTHPGFVAGGVQTISGKMLIGLTIYHANIEVTANADPVQYIVQVTPAASGDEDWYTFREFLTIEDTATETENLTATEGVGSKVIDVASTTNFTVGEVAYIEDVGVLADSEWVHIENVVASTSIDLMHGITNAKEAVSPDLIFDQAEIFHVAIDGGEWARYRVNVLHRAATGSDIQFKVIGVSLNAIE